MTDPKRKGTVGLLALHLKTVTGPISQLRKSIRVSTYLHSPEKRSYGENTSIGVAS